MRLAPIALSVGQRIEKGIAPLRKRTSLLERMLDVVRGIRKRRRGRRLRGQPISAVFDRDRRYEEPGFAT